MQLFSGYTIETLIRDLVSLFTLFGVIFALYKTIRMTSKELRERDNQNKLGEVGIQKTIIQTLQDTTATAVARAFDFEKQILEQDKKISAFDSRLAEVECENMKKDAIIEALQDWAERLVHQVQSLGHEPVKMKAVREVDCRKKK